jgi:cobalt-zinc-cadmium resistance protein CzcA
MAEFPDEIEHIWTRLGTAEVATDPMGIELTDFFLALKPRGQWTKAKTQPELTEKMRAVFQPGAGHEARVQPAHRDAYERNDRRRARATSRSRSMAMTWRCCAGLGGEVQHMLAALRGASEVSGNS